MSRSTSTWRVRDGHAPGGTLIEEPAAFGDLDFGEEPLAFETLDDAPITLEAPPAAPARSRKDARGRADAHIDAEVPPPVSPEEYAATSGGIAYITVTDAAGRVLFRRAATPNEVADALRSADSAQAEGEAAMDRISYDRLYTELNAAPKSL